MVAIPQAQPQWQFDGVDPSAAMLQLARTRLHAHLPRVRFHQGTIDIAPAGVRRLGLFELPQLDVRYRFGPGDEAARRRLEAIIHPRVRAQLRATCEAAVGTYAIAAIPLLAEGGGRETYPWADRILVVDVPTEVQQSRLMQRDGSDAELAQRMIAAQASREQRLAVADDVIVNDGPLLALQGHVEALDRLYRRLAAGS